ncbi:hypothetical protein FB45DRAFT_998278 [Roridomyces roridus]|uniref:F-box domain-containing protein n=1 Tax=Roridomyces roridus TaxID=1738132 RepID=A0AAD7FW97_9AGAR|nr:hypothetical protein FB45DRAFT_998278 [Roridomyces roridus]
MSLSTCSACGSTVCNPAGSDLDSIVPGATPWTLMRCQQLATTNEVPNSAEVAFARDLISRTSVRLTSLDDEILALEDRLEHLKAKRAKLFKYHSDNVSVLSPLRRMPFELLAEIFSWSLPSRQKRGDASSVERSPWILARICSRWRQVAVSTPSLWSTIKAIYGVAGVPQLAMIRTQVERARRSLKICFHGSENVDSSSQLELFQFLSEHSAQWEVLNMQLTTALVPLLGTLRGRLPSLRKLILDWDKAESQVGVDSIKCFETAPSLRDVSIQPRGPGVRFIPVPFPSHQLTTYRLIGPWETHQRILQMAPNLVEARLVVLCDNAAVWPVPSSLTITLPHLERLHVTRVEALNYLRAPKLAELGVWIKEPGSLITTLDAFLLRSSCTPYRLCVEGLPHAPTTAEILEKYAFFTSLTIIYGFKGSRAVAGLDGHLTMLDRGDHPVLPHLTEISFGSLSRNIPVDYPLFLKMLQSRRRTVGPSALTSAAFINLKGLEPDAVTLAGLNDLSRDGLRLVLGSHVAAKSTFKRWTLSVGS